MSKAYRISDDRQEMNLDVVYQYLTRSYWSTGIPKETVKKAMDNSLCFAVFCGDDQVGFARMVTDQATFAYLCDVFILEEHRGKGLSKKLMIYIKNYSELQGLRRIMLVTRDAHELYKPFGFTEPNAPNLWMEISDPGIYQT
ncbi:MAG: GNAT family N-acetyltransferase [Cellvibrionaceae bacterium]